jgi:hypothetical protein
MLSSHLLFCCIISCRYVFQEAELPHWEHLASLGLSASAGDLFLWDSRTAHQNIGPAATTAWRHVVYACYQPRCACIDIGALWAMLRDLHCGLHMMWTAATAWRHVHCQPKRACLMQTCSWRRSADINVGVICIRGSHWLQQSMSDIGC